MSGGGTCLKHGPQESWAIVCLGIGDALKEDQAVGFVWGGDDGARWALCSHCDKQIAQGHARPHKPVPLCNACFIEAWQLNGKPEKFE